MHVAPAFSPLFLRHSTFVIGHCEAHLPFNSIQSKRFACFNSLRSVIPLFRNQFPSSKAELAEALNDVLGRYVKKESGPLVTVSARVFPYLDEIAVNLDGAELASSFPPVSNVVGETKSAIEAGLLSLSGREIKLRGIPLNLQMTANSVVMRSGRDESDQAVLVPQSIQSGHIAIAASQKDLEKAIGELAREEGAKHGIAIEDLRIALRARGARSISADIHVRARKLLFRTEMDISGQLEIDDAFQATISNLKCRATGAIGSVACGILQPYLDKIEGRNMSLTSFPFSGIKLKDVRVTVADTVEVTADFVGAA
jgi:hypothetical protein